jgi:hypothetical protein
MLQIYSLKLEFKDTAHGYGLYLNFKEKFWG